MTTTPLTEREIELVRWTAAGLTDREIGTKMFLGEATIKVYSVAIRSKLGVRNRVLVARYAIAHGLVPVPTVQTVRDVAVTA